MSSIEARLTVDEALPGRHYDRLREIARQCLARRWPGESLQPTALVHEAYIKLVRGGVPPVRDGQHVVALLARAMRQVLVNQALARRTLKREAAGERVALDDALAFYERSTQGLVELDEALERLEFLDPRQSRIVDMRFFGAMTCEEIADVLEISARTVEREWRSARAWLRAEIKASRTLPDRDPSRR